MNSDAQETVISYKGFDSNMQCRGFQYKVGETYTHDGKVAACESGFHACEYPLDVFNYYAPASSKFAVVEQSGKLSRHDDASKVASSSLTVKASIDLPGLISAAFEFVLNRCVPEMTEHATGHRSASSATGYSSASSATGYGSASSATGYGSASSATGDSSASSATGHSSASSATGHRSASRATGDSSASSATGYSSASSATGHRSASSATGHSSASSATGDSSASSATGYRSASSATGYGSASSSTGYVSASSATGDSSASSATGHSSASSATGHSSASLTTGLYSSSEIKPYDDPDENLNALAIAAGGAGKARAPLGCAIVCVNRDNDGNIVRIRASKVGENGVKPNVWYSLDAAGEFVEAKD